jgi:hypothetical protein
VIIFGCFPAGAKPVSSLVIRGKVSFANHPQADETS